MTARIGPGAFIAVVGASGVGKDALIDAAGRRCGDDVLVVRRAITRPAGPGEDHLPVTVEEFADAQRRGGFCIAWHAHGLDYGIPIGADDVIRDGGAVVANVSRAVIGELRERYERVVAVRITVSDATRAARLHARRRESADEIATRLTRPDPAAGSPADHEIHNDGTVAEGADRLLGIIRQARAASEARA